MEERTFLDAAIKVGGHTVANAFRNATFVYGTQGKGSSTVMAAKAWAARGLSPTEEGVARKLNLFEPGVRVGTYISRGVQMMDMYYGQEGNDLYKLRDPIIAQFIHHVMGYRGPFSMAQSGRDAFLKSTGAKMEGWEKSKDINGRTVSGPLYNGNTATVEISRAIRWGIARFGGKLIFEGKQVYYSQVFNKQGYKGDTDREAVALFEYFQPGQSTVKFGRGTLTFFWNGREVIPTHAHFLSNWGFPLNAKGTLHWGKQTIGIIEQESIQQGARVLNQYSSKKPGDIGALQHHRFNRGDFSSWLKQNNVVLNDVLWNKFRDVPAGLEGIPMDKILSTFDKGLALGYI